jgi:hypothetical protein
MAPRVGAGMPVKSVVSSVSSNENETMAPRVGDRDGWSINKQYGYILEQIRRIHYEAVW